MFNIDNTFNPEMILLYMLIIFGKNNPIADENRWGSFNVLVELTNNRLKEIIEDNSFTDNNDYLKYKIYTIWHGSREIK